MLSVFRFFGSFLTSCVFFVGLYPFGYKFLFIQKKKKKKNSSGEQVLSGERNLPVHAGARHAPPVIGWQDPCLSRAFFPTLASRIEMAKSWVHDSDLSDIRGLDSFFSFQVFSLAILAMETGSGPS